MCRRSHFKEKKGQIHECGKQERVIKRRKITAGEETSAAAQGWIFSTSGAVHQAAVEEWRGAAAPLSLTVWFKELLFASLALCLSVALKGREPCLCSLIGICLKNNNKKKKVRKTRERVVVWELSTLNPLVSHWVTRQKDYFTGLHMICLHSP